MYHNMIGVDVAFDGFPKIFGQKLGARTLFFLLTTMSSQQIFIP
jgi:hypothetical protein